MTQAVQANIGPGWLVDEKFDSMFIFGTAAFAILAGIICIFVPTLFMPVLFANLWILGYHHVISTFSRLCFDRKSHRKSLWLIYALFPVVFALVLVLALKVGVWILTTIYLYAQWFHYARQSWGVSRAYERKAPQGYIADRSWQTQVVFYGVPLLGILYWSWRAPTKFLGFDLKVVPVSSEVLVTAAIIGAGLFIFWLSRIYRDWKKGVLPRAYTYFMMSHFGVFGVYMLMPTVDSAWLVANIWHNIQYILFVWVFNTRIYSKGIDPEAKFLSFISQRHNFLLYFGFMMFLTLVVYAAVGFTMSNILTFVPLIVAYQAINFHHYIVDAIIWRSAWINKGRPLVAVPVGKP
jgi:hypothetical protein